MIVITVTTTYEVDLSDEELTAFLDRHGCPPQAEDETPEDRFFGWLPTADAERELLGLSGGIDNEDTEYDVA